MAARRQFRIKASRSGRSRGETFKIAVSFRPPKHGTEAAPGPAGRPLCGVEKIVQSLILTGRLEPRRK